MTCAQSVHPDALPMDRPHGRTRPSIVEKRAYIRPWRSETQRTDAWPGLHFCSHHRAHGAFTWAPGTSPIRDEPPAKSTTRLRAHVQSCPTPAAAPKPREMSVKSFGD
jgi:hypothetical protein